MGNRQPEGYGLFKVAGRTVGAHRFSLELSLGRPITPGMQARHLVCDNPPCVNPAHLAEGTQLDNERDKVAKGRQVRGDRHWTRTRPDRVLRGPSHPRGNARLSWDSAAEIRRRVAAGETQLAVATAMGVHQSTVSLIISGKTWAEPSA